MNQFVSQCKKIISSELEKERVLSSFKQGGTLLHCLPCDNGEEVTDTKQHEEEEEDDDGDDDSRGMQCFLSWKRPRSHLACIQNPHNHKITR